MLEVSAHSPCQLVEQLARELAAFETAIYSNLLLQASSLSLLTSNDKSFWRFTWLPELTCIMQS